MLDEGKYEDENEDENSINPDVNYDNMDKIKNEIKHSTKASTHSEKESIKNDKEEKEEKKSNKKEEFQEEKEVDQITELVEKYKSILMKIPGDEREDAIIYGLKAIYVKSKNKIKNGVVYCDDGIYLQFLSQDESTNPTSFKIKLASISDIILGLTEGYLKDLDLPIEGDNCLTIKYNDGYKHIDLIFKRVDICETFLSGLISAIKKMVNEGLTYDSDLISLKRIWRQYDTERNKYLDLKKFSQFLKQINFDFKDKGPEKIFNDIEKKDNDKITFKEFISFYELLVSGEEFKEVFQKYSTDDQKKYITIKGLIEFFDKEQNQILYPEEAINLICKFSNKARKNHKTTMEYIEKLIKNKKIKVKKNKKEEWNEDNYEKNLSSIMNIITNDLFNLRFRQNINVQHEITTTESMLKDYESHTLNKSKQINDFFNGINLINGEQNELIEIKKQLKKNLQLSFRKFKNLLIDHRINNVFNKEKILRNQDMDHPITDYFVNSSHNTYLEGNQIYGSTSTRMYPYVFDNGTRFVDLDTYDNREGNEPIITHWHFPVGSITFKDALISIKNSAFQKNEYPVILSLENHCGDACQEKMHNYFLSIIGRENLYILDSKIPPLQFPSPNQLKKKFIIKNKRKRIFGDLPEMKLNYERLYNNILEENKKKNKLSISLNPNKNELDLYKSKSSDYTQNISEKQRQIINKYQRKDVNNNKDSKEDGNIVNDVIEEEKSESVSSDESDVLDKADEKVANDSDEIANKIRVGTYSFIKGLTSNPNFIVSNHVEISYHPENINFQSLIRKSRKRTNTKKTEAKYEFPKIIPLSKLVFNKIKVKFAINDEIESLPPDESIVELEEKGKVLKKLEDIYTEDSKKAKKKIKIITIDDLANILGMVGVKYHKETFDPYQFLPWECISISENDILKYISVIENKYKIMEYCKSSFLKIYPDGLRTDSSNQDVISCWALGCQFCALNLQRTDDDCTLINKIFFKLNGGSKCGYVLKPKWLREFNVESFKKMALNPKYKIKFEILSGLHLHLTIPSGIKVKGMFVEVTLKSPNSFFDRAKEEKEEKLVTNIINKNFLHPVFSTNCITFNS